MIVRIRQRDTFQRLTREGVRIRRSNLWCTWCPQSDSTSPAVAFAIGRAVGPAVARNRLRRRLRAVLTELDRSDPLPPAAMLIGARPSARELTFDQVRRELAEIVSTIRAAMSPLGS